MNYFSRQNRKKSVSASQKSCMTPQECVESNECTTKNMKLDLVSVKQKAKSRSYVQACKEGKYACKRPNTS